MLNLTIPDSHKHLTDLEKTLPEAIPEEFHTSSLLRILTWCSMQVDQSLLHLLEALDETTQDPCGNLVITATRLYAELTNEALIAQKLIEGVTVVFNRNDVPDVTPHLQKFLSKLSLPVLVYVLNYLPQFTTPKEWDEHKYQRVCIDASHRAESNDTIHVELDLVCLEAGGINTPSYACL